MGKWHKHHKHCKRASFPRDTSFDRPDLLNTDNSYIAITNADNFQRAELDVLRGMVVMVDDDGGHEDPTTQAFFENGEDGGFYAEGEVTQVGPSQCPCGSGGSGCVF